MTKPTPRIGILGAGIAGLAAARVLRAGGFAPFVFDKGRGIGGRMATRRTENAVFDHGAQYFTARSEQFQALLSDAEHASAITVWCHGFEGAGGHPRWRGVNGMTDLPKFMANGIEVHRSTQASAITRQDSAIEVRFADASPQHFDGLIATCPVPQALALLDATAFACERGTMSLLAGISYSPCFALMVELDGPSAIPPPGGRAFDPPEPIAWVADNTAKGVSRGNAALTLHAGPLFSKDYRDHDRAEVQGHLLDAAAPLLGGSRVLAAQLHRWLYAFAETTWDGPPYAQFSTAPPLLLAGDAFHSPKVEGAFLSGSAAAEHLVALLA